MLFHFVKCDGIQQISSDQQTICSMNSLTVVIFTWPFLWQISLRIQSIPNYLIMSYIQSKSNMLLSYVINRSFDCVWYQISVFVCLTLFKAYQSHVHNSPRLNICTSANLYVIEMREGNESETFQLLCSDIR